MLNDAETAFESVDATDLLNIERFVPKVRTDLGEAGEGGKVTFTSSGTETVLNGATTLLDGAEQAGLTPASGCRMGICHTCIAPSSLVASEMFAPANSFPSPAPRCRSACRSRPAMSTSPCSRTAP